MAALEDELQSQHDRASERVKDRVAERHRNINVLQEDGGIARADTPERVAVRVDRLSDHYSDIRPVSPAGVRAGDPAAMRAATAILERVINTPDFLSIRYLEGGVLAARSVGRVNIKDRNGRLAGYGTGSLVSPRLLLTNHHVLPDAETATASTIEFNYQDGLDGRPLAPRSFPLDPDSYFLASEDLDFALVAVRCKPGELLAFGFNRLIAEEGKVIVGDFVSIVQHPLGQMKQVALRENRIVDVLELFLHYETDTDRGSSGSPVFNDQWELVALHHASVPAPDHTELGRIVNEGIRVSRLVRHIREHTPRGGEDLLAEAFGDEAVAPSGFREVRRPARETDRLAHRSDDEPLRVTVPLEITVRAGRTDTQAASLGLAEAISIDPDYGTRQGYDPSFLGPGDHSVPLPALPEDLIAIAATNTLAAAEPAYLLPYHHFSVVLNTERGLAFFTAVNIDGETSQRLPREPDRWHLDPRVSEEDQVGEEVYRNNDLDRGHLVRRLDPAWGRTKEEAKVSNDDTFHFTNCTPQHKDFNQLQTLWAGLEDYILDNADNLNFRVSVFTGPVFAVDDDEYRGVKLPRQYWKVVAMVKDDGSLSATGYVLSQEELIRGLEFVPEAFSYGAYRTYQVPIEHIESLTQLSFGELKDADPLARLEVAAGPKEVRRTADLVL